MIIPKVSNALFPVDYSYGAQASSRFKTDVVMAQSGWEKRTISWQDELQEFNVSHNIKTEEQISLIIKFFKQMRGSAVAFKFKNWVDFTCDKTEGIINDNGFFQCTPKAHLFKKYQVTSDLDYYSKKIIHIVNDEDRTYFDFNYNLKGVLNAPGITIDKATGEVTCPLLRTLTVHSITNEVNPTVSVADLHNLVVGNYVYLKNIVNMTYLNNKSFKIIEVIDVNTFKIETDTSISNSAGSGSIELYYQPTDDFWWEGEFYIPVRFAEDVNTVSFDTYGAFSVPCRVLEIRV